MGAIVASHIHVTPGDPRFVAQFVNGFSTSLRVAAGIAFAGALVAAVLIRRYRHFEAAELAVEAAA
jgi:hypothetical protein